MAGAVRQNGRLTRRFVLTCSRFFFFLFLTLSFTLSFRWSNFQNVHYFTRLFTFSYKRLILGDQRNFCCRFFFFFYFDVKKIMLHSFFQLSTPHLRPLFIEFASVFRQTPSMHCIFLLLLLHINSSNIDTSNNATPSRSSQRLFARSHIFNFT